MATLTPFQDFTARFKLLISKHPDLITTTLSNIFTMRLIGNKTHGDLAEIAIAEFINQYMYDFRSVHVGKDLFRAKSQEEDITITNEITQREFPLSLKAYGHGPLQLSTDKDSLMFPRLERLGKQTIAGEEVKSLLSEPVFTNFGDTNVLPLIYDEKSRNCNILVFHYNEALKQVEEIRKVTEGSGRKHPVYGFYDKDGGYICEVRYGDARANALQRGLWTHTKNAEKHFESLTNGWIGYSNNHVLVKLFSHALISSSKGHAEALEKIKEDIERLQQAMKSVAP